MTGKLVWLDLTVPDAERVRDFYAQVVGWEPEGVDMGDEDFAMKSRETGEAVAALVDVA